MRKIPKHAKKVYNGEIFSIYRWKQKMFDGSHSFFENAETTDGVSIIASHNGKVVILRQQQPGTPWYDSLPGGAVDHKDEPPKLAAERELLEETGLKATKMKLWKKVPSIGRINSMHYIFIASETEKVGEQNLDGGEKIIVKFVTFEQLLLLSDSKEFRNKDVIIELLRARLSPMIKTQFKTLLFGQNPKKS